MIKRYILGIVSIITVITFGFVTANTASAADRVRIEYLAEKAEILETVHDYFNKRYNSRATNQIEDFQDITDTSPQSKFFILSETKKLAIEIHNAEDSSSEIYPIQVFSQFQQHFNRFSQPNRHSFFSRRS